MSVPASSERASERSIAHDVPWSQRWPIALSYPLRGAALVTLVVLVAAHFISLLLPFLGEWVLSVLIWVSVFMYALECLRRTGDGYTEPPEVTLYANYAPGITLLFLQVVGMIATALAAAHAAHWLWFVVIALVLILPSVTMALALEDDVLASLSPATLARAISGFGIAYLIPIGIGALQQLAYLRSLAADHVMTDTLWFALVLYLLLLNFHLMGVLMHRHHERIGHTPESTQLRQAFGRDADSELLGAVDRLAAEGETEAAIARLRERLRDGRTDDTLHRRYRELLQRADRHDELLAHAREYIGRLLVEGQPRRALGVVQASLQQDPAFVPAAPEHCAELADAAIRHGMPRLALTLARAYPNTWPREADAARCGLIAANLLADPFERRAEAGVLASKLLDAYPDTPLRADIQALLARLDMHRGGSA